MFEEPIGLPPRRPFDHSIIAKEGATSTNVRPYRYAFHQKNEIKRQVLEMLNLGIITHNTSSYLSLVLLVRNKDESWHFCTNYRASNEVTIKDWFPIPTVDNMLDELQSQFFFKLDLRLGYCQIWMQLEDVHKTTFQTHNGHYEYLVMPYAMHHLRFKWPWMQYLHRILGNSS